MRKLGAENAGSWKGVAKSGATTESQQSAQDVTREVEAPKKKTRKKKENVTDAAAPETPEVDAPVEESVPEPADKAESK